MRARLGSWWFTVRDTLWPIPAAMTTAAVVLALLLIQLDEQVLVRDGVHRWWLFSGGAAGARGVLSTIAATSMTIATTAFSITIVALQLGSSQFSPRILRGFTGDRGNQMVLGIFTATFAYSLVVLRAVKTESDDRRTFVPGTAVTIALLLAFVMIGALIYFFHHATRNIQAPVIVERAARDTRALIESEIGRRETMMRTLERSATAVGEPQPIKAQSPGYIQNIELGALVQCAKDWGGVIRVARAEGSYVIPGATLAVAWLTDRPNPESAESDERKPVEEQPTADEQEASDTELRNRVRDTFFLGMERTLEHDVDLGFRQLSDIALKALSPGINDPTTALLCIDRLRELLVLAVELRSGMFGIWDDDEQLRVLIEFDGFDVYLGIAFDQIRHYGAGDATVVLHLLEALHELDEHTTSLADRQQLRELAALVVEESESQSLPQYDRTRINKAALWAMPA